MIVAQRAAVADDAAMRSSHVAITTAGLMWACNTADQAKPPRVRVCDYPGVSNWPLSPPFTLRIRTNNFRLEISTLHLKE